MLRPELNPSDLFGDRLLILEPTDGVIARLSSHHVAICKEHSRFKPDLSWRHAQFLYLLVARRCVANNPSPAV
jgi:hypothetical protein